MDEKKMTKRDWRVCSATEMKQFHGKFLTEVILDRPDHFGWSQDGIGAAREPNFLLGLRFFPCLDHNGSKWPNFFFVHEQDCCESVWLAEGGDDLKALEGSMVVSFEEVVEQGRDVWGSETWTFYKIQTTTGNATLRFVGSSNGYYSERVSFIYSPSTAQPPEWRIEHHG